MEIPGARDLFLPVDQQDVLQPGQILAQLRNLLLIERRGGDEHPGISQGQLLADRLGTESGEVNPARTLS